MSNSVSQEVTEAPCQFLTIHYNPAAHPRQISLLDTNGQQILYTLIPSNQDSSVQAVPQQQSNNIPMIPNATKISSNANVCCICGSHAVAKCTYGISRGTPCARLLCLSHICELPGANGGRYPHCPEHYQYIQQNKCNVM
ncbi:unnamed protein product [Rotaria sp. Silwood1]|nr:unnamed protein product [Rotaria sp. Silwood1]CAF1004758.1 unnamed protein product [Rotaria sp. Silwood1]CAF3387530.1 unnamed protein product [Rotaria sp. Silwood1]CAF3415681.1 unnamed protein product [Rotaria sp. Silwood1]CAF4528157.1 unnamed protein product [Rotaria sp. Silwood1]